MYKNKIILIILSILLFSCTNTMSFNFEEAIKSGNIEKIKLLLKNGVNINAINKKGQSALHIALREKRISIAKLLIEKGININVRNKYGRTPLMSALYSLSWSYKKKNNKLYNFIFDLISKTMDINVINTAFMYALKIRTINIKKKIRLLKTLISKGANVNVKEFGEIPLFIAAQNNDITIINFLIRNNADVRIKDNEGNTLLMKIMVTFTNFEFKDKKGLKLVKYLLKKGLNVNAINNKGNTVLMDTITYSDNYELIKFYLDNGAKINIKNNNGLSVLSIAVEHARLKIIKLLISKGADVKIVDNNLNSLIHLLSLASIGTNFKKILTTAKYLIKKGVNLNAKNRDGNTALMILSRDKNNELSKLFLNNGAEINIKNNKGLSALSYAINQCNYKKVKFLVSKGADLNVIDNNGNGLLNRITLQSNYINRYFIDYIQSFNERKKPLIKIAKYLIKKGINLNAIDKDGNTALMKIVFDKDNELTKLYLNNGAKINHTNKNGLSALSYAISRLDLKRMILLLSKGADFNVIDCEGNNLLSRIALRYKQLDKKYDDKSYSGLKEKFNIKKNILIRIAFLILEKGINVKTKNKAGLTPLEVAQQNGFDELVELIKKK